MQAVSVYIHIPFCQQRCGYCDFTTYAGMTAYLPAYVKALVEEIEGVGRAAPQPVSVHTVYFGGGTPSLLSSEQVDAILRAIREHFEVFPTAEISLEANPGTVNAQSLTGYREAGVNRISIGMQSAIPEELALLQRIHSAEEVCATVNLARSAGFDAISLDLIFGIPNQTMETWKHSLDFALAAGVEHLSLYNLTIEENTPLFEQVKRGEIVPVEDDLAADMYEDAIDYLSHHGFIHYEISNWAANRSGVLQMCRHNLQYWRNLPYLGFGVGAHGFINNQRLENTPHIPDYLSKMKVQNFAYPKSPATIHSRSIGAVEQMNDTMMLGLRLLEEGVEPDQFFKRFGVSMEEVFAKELSELVRLGLLEKKQSYRLTRRGMLVGNQVFMRFVNQ